MIGGAVFSALGVMANLNPSVQGIPQVIPYQGVLELNGTPLNRTLTIEFQLYDTINQENEQFRYKQEITNIEVYQGRFTALIGPQGEDSQGNTIYLTDVIASTSQLYLGMTLVDPDTNERISMSNRQRLMSTPYAMWASGASRFTVQQNLNVGGEVAVAGNVRVGGALTMAGDSRVVIDQSGGWHRSYGNTGWLNQTHGGGWYMSDPDWIRSYGDKDVYTNCKLRADGGLQVGPSEGFF
jgi:hypothetical protein